MVMCKMDSVSIPKPPAFPDAHVYAKAESGSIRSKSSHGFRLVDDQGDSGSVYSVYKQKIDAMFESDSSANTKNSVQAKIEKMFCDVAKDNGIPMNDIGCHVFSVDYLGSVPLHEKVTSLAGLQTPLRELYFGYKKTSKHKEALTGRLEISAAGLKVQYQGENGDLEQLNSFPTIAVWSAVKFVLHDDTSASYAFLPLITDPDNIDKQTLFRALEPGEKKLVEDDSHSPLFAVVMRKFGVHKQLECHGFVCQTSEDAIVVAATLYKSLMAHMKLKEMRPKNRNGVTCMSIASSIFNEKSGSSVPVRPPRKKRSTTSSIASDGEGLEVSDTQPLLESKAKKSSKSKKAPKAPESKQDLDAIVPYEEPIQTETTGKSKEPKQLTLTDKWSTYKSKQQKVITAEIKQVLEEGPPLKRVQSVRRRNSEGMLNTLKENSGDILTKVTIPRSGSFLNAGGLTRYKSKVYRSNGQASGGSPLGFHELFNEFRLQEGLHSVDEILSVIIDPEGMSFNDLKPIYKEFLLKLALTLTKDELYQRSKAIMRRQKKKLLRRNSAMHPKKPHTVMGSKFKRLGSIFKKPLKLKINKRSKSAPSLRTTQIPPRIDLKMPESSISTSSYDTRQFHPREPALATRKSSYRRRSSESKMCHNNNNRIARERASTSEESDFFSLRRSKAKQNHLGSTMQNRNSSSGYVSCSECSYDSDTCTCVSADKCYCSLGNKSPPKRSQKPKHSYQNVDRCSCGLDSSLVWCGCDTDSCTDSNKCYCQVNAERNGTIFEQLKQRGFIPSAASVAITPPHHRKLCKRASNSKSTRSLEYMHNPSEAYYEKLGHRPGSVMDRGRGSIIVDKRRRSCNLPLDYELFAIAEGSVRGMANGFMYGKSLSEHMKVYQPASVRSRQSMGYGSNGKSLQSTTITSGACNEALSVKKSAEIAALFADIKLSQTTDITHIVPQGVRKTSISSGRTTYNKIVPMKSYSKLIRQSPNEIVPYQKIVQNSLYASKGMQKSGLYSATNGLYTIQSQSDESRRSSISAVDRQKDNHDYFNVENKNVSQSSMENSLGYLP